MTHDRIAVVGAGVPGLTAAHLAYCEVGFATHHLDVARIRLTRRAAP